MDTPIHCKFDRETLTYIIQTPGLLNEQALTIVRISACENDPKVPNAYTITGALGIPLELTVVLDDHETCDPDRLYWLSLEGILTPLTRDEAFLKGVPVVSTQYEYHIRMIHAFGYKAATDKDLRDMRFGEEALELLQARGRTREEVLRLVDYVYGRETGEVEQEMAGVLTTLMAMASQNGTDLVKATRKEMDRFTLKNTNISRKSAGKPKFSDSTIYSLGNKRKLELPLRVIDAVCWCIIDLSEISDTPILVEIARVLRLDRREDYRTVIFRTFEMAEKLLASDTSDAWVAQKLLSIRDAVADYSGPEDENVYVTKLRELRKTFTPASPTDILTVDTISSDLQKTIFDIFDELRKLDPVHSGPIREYLEFTATLPRTEMGVITVLNSRKIHDICSYSTTVTKVQKLIGVLKNYVDIYPGIHAEQRYCEELKRILSITASWVRLVNANNPVADELLFPIAKTYKGVVAQ